MTPAEAFAKAQKAQAPKPGTWARDFAFKRRLIDRAILAEAERAIAAEEAAQASQKPQDAPISFAGPSIRQQNEEARAAIARAFGRPLK